MKKNDLSYLDDIGKNSLTGMKVKPNTDWATMSQKMATPKNVPGLSSLLLVITAIITIAGIGGFFLFSEPEASENSANKTGTEKLNSAKMNSSLKSVSIENYINDISLPSVPYDLSKIYIKKQIPIKVKKTIVVKKVIYINGTGSQKKNK